MNTNQKSTNLQSANHKSSTPLVVEDLWVEYQIERGVVQAVRGISFALAAGESLALIGESGCGKTTLGLALIRLLVKAARISKGEITYWRNNQGTDILSLTPQELRRFRWKECAMVFQSALNAFNPVLRIWDQMYDTVRAHGGMNKSAARARAIQLLEHVQLDPKRVIDAYPHELSGGMRQRVLLAMSMLLDPQILILDEPTTALDILTQRTIIDLLRRLKQELGFAMIFISHDLATAAELADRVATMYAGNIVEMGSVDNIFYHPVHPYTLGLIRAVPTVTGEFEDLVSIPGSPPDMVNPPSGCKFHPRCTYADARCRQQEPRLQPYQNDAAHTVACFHTQLVARDAAKLWHYDTQPA